MGALGINRSVVHAALLSILLSLLLSQQAFGQQAVVAQGNLFNYTISANLTDLENPLVDPQDILLTGLVEPKHQIPHEAIPYMPPPADFPPDKWGNRIPDFSQVGYRSGHVPLPQVPVKITLQPSSDPLINDRARIQNAIDWVGRQPLRRVRLRDNKTVIYARGAVLLQAGIYRVQGSLILNQSGVVLRGEGNGPDGTILIAMGQFVHDFIILNGLLDSSFQGDPEYLVRYGGDPRAVQPKNPYVMQDEHATPVAHNYIPVGVTRIPVQDISPFKVGREIVLERRPNDEWIHLLGMDHIPPRPGGKGATASWKAKQYKSRYIRKILKVQRARHDSNKISSSNSVRDEQSGAVKETTEREGEKEDKKEGLNTQWVKDRRGRKEVQGRTAWTPEPEQQQFLKDASEVVDRSRLGQGQNAFVIAAIPTDPYSSGDGSIETNVEMDNKGGDEKNQNGDVKDNGGIKKAQIDEPKEGEEEKAKDRRLLENQEDLVKTLEIKEKFMRRPRKPHPGWKPGYLTLDIPTVMNIDPNYGRGIVYNFKRESSIPSDVGVENLALWSEFDPDSLADEQHAWYAVSVDNCEHCWVADIRATNFVSGVKLDAGSKHVTVQDCEILDPISEASSGGRRYMYLLHGQMGLVKRCYATNARHDFLTGGLTPGPNVFVDSQGDNANNDAGPHSRWATGTLYDNIHSHGFNIRNRGWMGSGQGWAGAFQVGYKCTADTAGEFQSPPGGTNWIIDFPGKLTKHKTSQFEGESATFLDTDDKNQDKIPRSLYWSQLVARTGSSDKAAKQLEKLVGVEGKNIYPPRLPRRYVTSQEIIASQERFRGQLGVPGKKAWEEDDKAEEIEVHEKITSTTDIQKIIQRLKQKMEEDLKRSL
ncbi:hypothetical protein EDD11_002184 [Mortierella claussenii]|nr:hypothetical protein EDD11_002184 [Mortierella claussenii]